MGDLALFQPRPRIHVAGPEVRVALIYDALDLLDPQAPGEAGKLIVEITRDNRLCFDARREGDQVAMTGLCKQLPPGERMVFRELLAFVRRKVA